MPAFTRAFLPLFLLCFFLWPAHAQHVTVNSITIYGLKKTKSSIVYRELTFAEGDTLRQMDLGPTLERNQNNLLNLGIFNEVLVNISDWDFEHHTVDIVIEVRESWYIYVLPILELADRNFNVWWTTHNRSLERLNLGLRMDLLNFSGHNDKLKGKLQFGYTPKQEIEYRFPYLNRSQSLSVSVGLLHSTNKEINYATEGNKEAFIKLDERRLLDRWKGEISAFYRPSHFLKYEVAIAWQHFTVDDEIIAEYNPLFFRKGNNRSDAVIVRLAGEYDDRDFKIFSARGLRVAIMLEKTGFGQTDDEDFFVSHAAAEWNIPSGRRLQHRFTTIGHYSLSRAQPSFPYFQGLGYEQNYVRGYELYTADGLDVIIGKYQIAYKWLDKKVNLGKTMPLYPFRTMPVQCYFSFFAETGYVHDPFTGEGNPLSNHWLYGVGPGIDIVLYNNFLFQVNVSRNHLNEWGVFLHNRTSF